MRDRPLTPLQQDTGKPDWQQINTMFLLHGLDEPPVNFRDELVTILSWARYGAALAADARGAGPVAVTPLEWVADHGVAAWGPYRLFQAETPLGRFSYGTDSEGSCYWHSTSSGVFMAGDEEAARRMAQAAWAKAALDEASKFISTPAALGVGSVAAELQQIADMLDAGQGDDDGSPILPDFEPGMSTVAKVEACLHLLERRRDVIEGALDAGSAPEGWAQIREQAEHVALGIACKAPDVTYATSVLIDLIRAAPAAPGEAP